MKTKLGVVAALSLTCFSANSFSKNLIKTANEASQVLSSWMGMAEDTQIPANLINSAKCVMVVPNLVKVAFIGGGRMGKGLVSCRTDNNKAWSDPIYTNIQGISWGFQAGIQSSDVVFVFTRPTAPERFVKAEFTLGTDASIAVGPLGRHAEIGSDVLLRSEVLTYSRNNGLFAGVSFEGSHIKVDLGDNREVYGPNFSTARDALNTTSVQLPQELKAFVDTLQTISKP